MEGFAGTCPSCGQAVKNDPFYSCEQQPANSVILCQTPEKATAISRGDVSLIFCPSCGFFFNAAYDAQICIYDRNYEETQAHSEVFNAFNHKLATSLLNSCQLQNKTILEIGCGKGDFLNLLCAMGNNRGIGYDPSYVAERSQTVISQNVTIYNRLFPKSYEGEQPDCIICKMTLEHISDVRHFLGRVRKSILPGNQPVVFFQVPDSGPILAGYRFWDIYYEHCSYFTHESLTHLFQASGFKVVAVTGGYDNQYLMIEAYPVDSLITELAESIANHDITSLVDQFSVTVRQHIKRWQQLFQTWHIENKTVVLWGGGSKAVSLLSALKFTEAVDCVVDINPYKQTMYLPGSGHRVVAPENLVDVQPDIILAMNPVYMEEIRSILFSLNISCELLSLANLNLNGELK